VSAPLIDPGMLDLMGDFFPSQARVEVKVTSQDPATGQEQEAWADVAGAGAVKAPLSAEERQLAGYTATDQAWWVLFDRAMPWVTTRHRLSIDGTAYDIDAVETDQTGSLTRLRVRQVST
jgi:head-tail joining protein